jgi:hypothetical protein
MSPIRESAANRLIVEGRDDQWSIINLTRRHGWDWDHPREFFPYIDDSRGVTQALEALPVAVKSCRRVGIVLDADVVPMNRWNAIHGRLSAVGFTLPDAPAPEGTIISIADQRIGVWLMPDNLNPGKLEDFLAILVPSEDPCWPWAESASGKAKELGAPYSELDFIKARIHAWLAWQAEPGLPFGTAINAAVFSHDTPLARSFVDWMTRLFA